MVKKVIATIKLFHQAFGRYQLQIIFMTLLGLVGGLVGGIGIGVIVPIFSLITDQKLSNDPFSAQIAQALAFFNIPSTLEALLLIVLGLFLFKAVILYFANYLNAKVSIDYENRERTEIFRRFAKADWPYLSEQKIGYASTTLMSEVYTSANILSGISNIIIVITSFIAYAFVAFKLSATITLTTLVVGILIFFGFKPLFYKIRKLSESYSDLVREVTHHINQHEIGTKIAKALSVEENVIQKASRYFDQLREGRNRVMLYSLLPNSFIEPLGLVLISAIFLFSYSRPSFNLASFVAIVYLIQKMFIFLQSTQARLNTINESLPYLSRVTDYKKILAEHSEQSLSSTPFTFKHDLKFKNVTFGYGTGEEVFLKANFVLKKGGVFGLIGPSGSGKTTIVDLLLRLFLPKEGEILIDGVNIQKVNLHSWRKNVGYVSQDVFLLNDTVENNIRFYDDKITNQEIVQAAKIARIYDFVQELPDKFSTLVGERGLKLSVGQRQRIALARVLARKPELLILDEATSALDNESEVLIQKAIEGLKGSVTVIIIAHRLSTVMNSDEIFTIADGCIVEHGSPEELIKNKDSYLYKTYHIRDHGTLS